MFPHTLLLLYNILVFCVIKNDFIYAENEICLNDNVTSALVPNWPCEWNNGTIPYAFNFYLLSPKRLVSIVKRGIHYIEERSCIQFTEKNPVELAKHSNLTYLFFTFSDALENCCLSFSYIANRQRLVLITPLCTLPVEVAHVILHALGLRHKKRDSFPRQKIKHLFFRANCTVLKNKMFINI